MAVNPWVLLDTASVPGGDGDLRLMRRGTEFSIMAGSTSLMNSRMSGSEEALASLSWAAISSHPRPNMLIVGLGMGFTLRAALAILPPDARITVAELVPAVVDWARGPMAAVFGASLSDPRVTIRQGDVGALLASDNLYDAILLDVDNGPEGLTRDANDRLYTVKGLRRTLTALRAGGVLARLVVPHQRPVHQTAAHRRLCHQRRKGPRPRQQGRRAPPYLAGEKAGIGNCTKAQRWLPCR